MTTLLKELLIAADNGNLDVVVEIAGKHPDLLLNTDTGTTPAYLAAQNGHASCLEIISQALPKSLSLPSQSGTTPAYIAAEKGYVDCLEIIAKVSSASFEVPNKAGTTPAIIAAYNGHADCLGIIAKVVPESFGTSNKDGNTPALIAAQNGHADCLKIISLAAPDTLAKQNKAGTTPAIAAAKRGHTDCLYIVNNIIGIIGKHNKRVFRYWRPSRWADQTNTVGKATARMVGTYDKNQDKWFKSPMQLDIVYKGRWHSVSKIDFDTSAAIYSNIAKEVVYTDTVSIEGKKITLFYYKKDWYYTQNNIPADEAALLVERTEVESIAGRIVIVLSLITLLVSLWVYSSKLPVSSFVLVIGIAAIPTTWFGMTWGINKKIVEMELQKEIQRKNEITEKEALRIRAEELQQRKKTEKVFMSWKPAPWQDMTKNINITEAKITGTYDFILYQWNKSSMVLDFVYDEKWFLRKIDFDVCVDIKRNKAKTVPFARTMVISKDKVINLFYYEKDWYYTREDIPAEDAALLIERTKRKKKEKLERIIENERNLGKAQSTKRHREQIPDSVKQYVWHRDQGKCVKCGSNENLEYDHIIPFSKGGSNTNRNLQLLCEKCNRQKGNRIA